MADYLVQVDVMLTVRVKARSEAKAKMEAYYIVSDMLANAHLKPELVDSYKAVEVVN